MFPGATGVQAACELHGACMQCMIYMYCIESSVDSVRVCLKTCSVSANNTVIIATLMLVQSTPSAIRDGNSHKNAAFMPV